MPRSSTYSPACTINFQTDERTRDALHAAARRQERSASAVIRLAIRAWLDGQAASSVTAQQHGGRDLAAAVTPPLVPVMNGGACAGFLVNLGPHGLEAFDRDEKSLGVFPDAISAATAVKKSAAPDAAGGAP
jgi:hypothetical protein